VSTGEYEKRMVQLDENPKQVFNVGGMGVDAIRKVNLLSKKELTEKNRYKAWKEKSSHNLPSRNS